MICREIGYFTTNQNTTKGTLRFDTQRIASPYSNTYNKDSYPPCIETSTGIFISEKLAILSSLEDGIMETKMDGRIVMHEGRKRYSKRYVHG